MNCFNGIKDGSGSLKKDGGDNSQGRKIPTLWETRKPPREGTKKKLVSGKKKTR